MEDFSLLADHAAINYFDKPPACIHDLNLDQIFKEIIANKGEFELASFFYTLVYEQTVLYRQAVMRDLLGNEILAKDLDLFAKTMVRLNQRRLNLDRADEFVPVIKQADFLEIMQTYVKTVATAERNLEVPIKSSGLRDFQKYLVKLQQQTQFRKMKAEIAALQAGIKQVKYQLLFSVGEVRIKDKGHSQPQLVLPLVQKDFSALAQDSQLSTAMEPENNRSVDIEERFLTNLEHYYPQMFKQLAEFYNEFQTAMDQTLLVISNEIEFYLSWLEEMRQIQQTTGLSFYLPELIYNQNQIQMKAIYDLVLAAHSPNKIVTNDYQAKANCPLVVITGPN
ncbi:MAG: hypothetical protein LKG31_02730 [Lactobacillus sp.]|jgi:DNA mismatch repair ATPase MutS|nr:hypothetical protein [Lactobacillus sp.]